MARECRRCLVSGRVQGVFYRASAAREAQRLGITGHAINLPDGRVEVLACGEPAAVSELVQWLSLGPANARVTGVEQEQVDGEAPAAFTTG